MIHEIKTEPIYFEAVISGKKTFEVRKDDRNYQENDVLILKEYDNNSYTGREYAVLVTYVQRDEYCKDGYCIMSIERDNYRNTLRVIKELGYNTAVFEDERFYKILFYKNTSEEQIIYIALCNKCNDQYYGVDFGRIEKDLIYDDDPDTGDVYLKDFTISWGCFIGISDYTTESISKAINICDEEIEEWGQNEYEFIVYFDNTDEIIKMFGEKNEVKRIE